VKKKLSKELSKEADVDILGYQLKCSSVHQQVDKMSGQINNMHITNVILIVETTKGVDQTHTAKFLALHKLGSWPAFVALDPSWNYGRI
jgi:hypothetical protein